MSGKYTSKLRARVAREVKSRYTPVMKVPSAPKVDYVDENGVQIFYAKPYIKKDKVLGPDEEY